MANWTRVYDYRTGKYNVYKDGKPSTETAYQKAMSDIRSDPTARTIPSTSSGGNTGNQLIADMTKAQAEAKAANEARYQEILGGYDQRYGDVMQSISGLGQTARDDLTERYRQASARGKQDMVDRGLTGTTVMPNMQRGYDRDYNRGLGGIEESLRRQQADTQANLQGDRLAFMERRTDAYPDVSAYSNILNQLGEAQGTAAANQAATQKRYSFSTKPTNTGSSTATQPMSAMEKRLQPTMFQPYTNWKSREPVKRESYSNPTTVVGGGNLPDVQSGGGYLITQNRDRFTVNPSGQIDYLGKDYGTTQSTGTGTAGRYSLTNLNQAYSPTMQRYAY